MTVDDLQTHVGLKSLPINQNLCAIYFLLKGGACVYVGQTENIYARVWSHRKIGRDFNEVKYLSCDVSELNEIERLCILLLRPIENPQPKGQFRLAVKDKKTSDLIDVLSSLLDTVIPREVDAPVNVAAFDGRRLVSTKEAANLLGISNITLRKDRVGLRRFEVPYIKIGRLIKYDLEDLNAYISKQTRTKGTNY